MATSPNSTQITPPRVPITDDRTGAMSREWYRWFYSLYNITGAGAGIIPVASGGTGLNTIPANGQLLIGNGTGYALNTLGTGSGISVTNGAGTISIANTGVLSNLAGTGISVSSATGNVTISNTGVLSFAGGTTGLTPATATTGAITLAGTLAIANGGTNGSSTPTAGAVPYGTGTAYAFTAAGTVGQVLTSNGAGVPTWTTPSTSSGTVTSVGQTFTGGIVSVTGSPITTSGTLALTVAGTSGGIPYFSSSSAWASSAALTQYGVVYGGGAGAAPVATAAGTTGQVLTANTGAAPTWGTISAGTVTSVGLSAPAIFTVTGSPVTTSGTLTLTYSGTALPTTSGGTGSTSLFTSNGVAYASSTTVLSTGSTLIFDGTNLGVGITPLVRLHVGGDTAVEMRAETSSSTAGDANVLLIGGRNTDAQLGRIRYYNKVSGSNVELARVQSSRDGADDAANLQLYTRATGGTITERLRITSAGGISFGSSGTAYGTTGQLLTSAGNAAPTWTSTTGSGNVVLGTSPTLVTPLLGTPASGIASNMTVDGTDAVGFRNVPMNNSPSGQSANYTTVLADSGKFIFHPSSDANARTFTIPANASVAYPIGTQLTFINMSAQSLTIAITTDTLYAAGSGSTAPKILNQYGVATATKMTATTWVISGAGLNIIPSSVTYLVVAGGGGSGTGASAQAGAGGAGGFLTGSLSVAGATSYTVTVGGGGAENTNGTNSVFSSVTSTGGGKGGSNTNTLTNGSTGGSGGGGSGSGFTGRAGGAGTAGQGNAGGLGILFGGSTGGGCGGGGGAGAVGADGVGNVGGNGGVGLANPIVGSTIGQNVAGTYYLAGGGGGTNRLSSGAAVGTGGNGGGGAGQPSTGGTNGTANTGGGAGGGQAAGGGIGGSGVVILAYPATLSDLTSIGVGLTYTKTTLSGNTVYTFTAGTGLISW